MYSVANAVGNSNKLVSLQASQYTENNIAEQIYSNRNGKYTTFHIYHHNATIICRGWDDSQERVNTGARGSVSGHTRVRLDRQHHTRMQQQGVSCPHITCSAWSVMC